MLLFADDGGGRHAKLYRLETDEELAHRKQWKADYDKAHDAYKNAINSDKLQQLEKLAKEIGMKVVKA